MIFLKQSRLGRGWAYICGTAVFVGPADHFTSFQMKNPVCALPEAISGQCDIGNHLLRSRNSGIGIISSLTQPFPVECTIEFRIKRVSIRL